MPVGAPPLEPELDELMQLPIKASQPAVVPPSLPAQVGPLAMPKAGVVEGVPALQRLAAVVGALVKVWFSAVPHAPLTTPPPELVLTTPLLEPELPDELPLEPPAQVEVVLLELPTVVPMLLAAEACQTETL